MICPACGGGMETELVAIRAECHKLKAKMEARPK